MRRLAMAMTGLLALGACGSDGGGQGFELYEVTPSGQSGPQQAETVMQGLPAVPRHVVNAAPSAAAAAAIRPYASDPAASVAAVATENTWLRVVDAGGPVWLVAEAGSGGAPDAARLRSEATQRSGCLAGGGATTVGRAMVFLLDCS
ncbi:MAG: hypothetical protein QNJ13_08285 [Paracoccaceae bacterium]|nr:hypothetical protein [Paracoccaceae bacterium]